MKSPRVKTLIERAIEAIGSISSLVVHTILFIVSFSLAAFGVVEWQTMLLVLTTIVSLEAIYLALFIQITVNWNTQSLREVEEDIDEIQEDVEELGEDVEDIQEDIEEISEDIDEIQEDVEEMSDEEKAEAKIVKEEKEQKEKTERRERREKKEKDEKEVLESLTKDVQRLLRDLEALQQGK
jgi:outer membrane biosynthesis protein TonB